LQPRRRTRRRLGRPRTRRRLADDRARALGPGPLEPQAIGDPSRAPPPVGLAGAQRRPVRRPWSWQPTHTPPTDASAASAAAASPKAQATPRSPTRIT